MVKVVVVVVILMLFFATVSLVVCVMFLFPCFLFIEMFFEMNKKNAREALDIYKKFLTRMERCSEFLKVAEVRKPIMTMSQ